MKKIIFLIFILILVGCNEKSDICNTNEDCEFLWTDYSKETPCPGCFYEDARYECTTQAKVISRHYEIAPLVGNIACEKCIETETVKWECKCENKKCVKTQK